MIRIIWSDPAVEQLHLIRKRSLRERVYRAVGGLSRFPLRGRVPPEVRRFPDLDLPVDLREIVFPHVVRVFYRFDDRHRVIQVLGMSFRGQEVGADWIARLIEG